MIKDLDREIVTIRYNLLNLPDTIQFKNGNHQLTGVVVLIYQGYIIRKGIMHRWLIILITGKII